LRFHRGRFFWEIGEAKEPPLRKRASNFDFFYITDLQGQPEWKREDF
jgi:hypothetical protein